MTGYKKIFFCCGLMMAGVLMGTGQAQVQWTAIQWEEASSPLSFNGVNHDSDFTGNLSQDHDADYSNADLGWTFVNGYAHGIAANWGAPGPKMELSFAGTGVQFRGLRYGGGHDTVDWRVESAGGAVVASGSANLLGDPADIDVMCADADTLPYGLYKLVIDPGYGQEGMVLVDEAQVYGCALERLEAEATHPLMTKTGNWATDTNFWPSAGVTAWSNTQGDQIRVKFFGSSVAVVNPYSDTGFGSGLGTFSWSIDGNAGGTINLSASTYPAFPDSRRITILASDLSQGLHELVCTVTSTGKPVMFDAFDFAQSLPAVVRYETENTSSPLHANGVNLQRDFVSELSLAHQADLDDAALGVPYSNGYAQYLADSWPLPGQRLDLNFSGDAIAVNLLQYSNGEGEVGWELQGVGGEVVSSGTVNLNSTTLDRPYLTVTPPQPGLYRLRLNAGRTVSDQLTVIDFFEVIGDTLSRMEDSDARILYSSAWVQGDDFGMPSGGTNAVCSVAGETMTVEFEGADIAVVTPFNPNMGVFEWAIDGGLAGSGTVDQRVSHFRPEDFTDGRVSTILAKGLSDEHHTLTITIAAQNTANVYIDAIDTNGFFLDASGALNGAGHWSLFE